jgi:hypothetical protein
MTGSPKKEFVPTLDYLFKKYIIDDKGKPRVKVHGLATTSLPLMQRYPWYSVDSARCMKLAVYGQIIIPNISFTNFHILKISDKNPNILQTISPMVLQRIITLGEIYNCPLNELVSSINIRILWNYLVFLDIIFTSRNKFMQEHIIDFYFAGTIHNKFEPSFWNRVAASDTFKYFNLTRLFSFMYKDVYLNFKENEKSIIR